VWDQYVSNAFEQLDEPRVSAPKYDGYYDYSREWGGVHSDEPSHPTAGWINPSDPRRATLPRAYGSLPVSSLEPKRKHIPNTSWETPQESSNCQTWSDHGQLRENT
jgi:hypothetical protein